MLIGAHMTIGKGYDKAALDARSIGATAMQVFTRNPRGGKARAVKDKELARMKDVGVEAIICHAPYVVNLASSKDDVREFGVQVIAEDLVRAAALGASGLVVHAGAHTGAGHEVGLARLIEGLEKLVPQVPTGVRILLETMPGSGTEIGAELSDFKRVLDHFQAPEALGVCMDTCHLHSAGYDMCNWQAFRAQLADFLPIEAVGCIHLNDSKTALASRLDRHERLGEGTIGWTAFETIAADAATHHIPIIMETPNELAGWADEIAHLRAAYNKGESNGI